MKVKCEYCDSYISDTEAFCPNCGAPNTHMQRSASGVPKTIPELQSFCTARNLPLEQMRFFIGEDYRQPRAYGVYQDAEGQFVVYKNKADGSRAVRYRGTDEAYAVNEIYQKLKSEIANQRAYQSGRGTTRVRAQNNKSKIALIIFGVVFALYVLLSIFRGSGPANGYYNYNGDYYYSQNNSWYAYDTNSYTWIPSSVDDELSSHYSDYYESYDYSSGYNVDDFSGSSYYVEPDYSSDWDDDSDWDWGGSDWDSGGSDWDSDW